MENLTNTIKEAGEALGFAFTLATPSEENLTADDLAKKLLWLDIQQDGAFNIESAGFRLSANLHLHFLDDMEWDEEGAVAEARKNEMLTAAYSAIRTIYQNIVNAGKWDFSSSPTWQVLYNVNDRNKIDIKVNLSVVSLAVNFC